jgi:hypothetical protein
VLSPWQLHDRWAEYELELVPLQGARASQSQIGYGTRSSWKDRGIALLNLCGPLSMRFAKRYDDTQKLFTASSVSFARYFLKCDFWRLELN